MSTSTVPRPADPRNGSGPDLFPPLHPVALATLAHDVDKLLDLRDAKRRLDADERALTRRVLDGLTIHGLPALRAERAVATVGTRSDLTVDPVRFVEAVGLTTAAPALRVLIEKARLVLGTETLSAIGETTTTATLRVDALRAKGATMRKRAVSTRKPRPAAHAHCEWLNDRHASYCRDTATRVFRHPRGLLGILFVCTAHALDALAEGKPLPMVGGPIGGAW